MWIQPSCSDQLSSETALDPENRFTKIGGFDPPTWMVKMMENPIEWMILGYVRIIWLVGWWSTKIEDQARTSPPAEAWGSSRPLNAAKVQPAQTWRHEDSRLCYKMESFPRFELGVGVGSINHDFLCGRWGKVKKHLDWKNKNRTTKNWAQIMRPVAWK